MNIIIPMTGYGSRFVAAGYKDVEMKIYAEDRHEILNEVDRDIVYNDILTWLEKRK